MLRNALLVLVLWASEASAFCIEAPRFSRRCGPLNSADETTMEVVVQEAEAPPTSLDVTVDPKEAVKVFGRLAEKYIMLDSSGGMCCYSACSDCEYRLPGGGYRMADQSAARPKWIPNYATREANGKDHTTQWSLALYDEGPAVSQDAFVAKLQQMTYAPTLGGPFVAARAGATLNDDAAAIALFQVLANGKDVLTKHQMSVRIKQLAGGEEGLTWNGFAKALGL